MKKYVYAIIKIPLEINDKDGYEPLTDYSAISFEECAELPEKSVSVTKTKFREFLRNITGSNEENTEDKMEEKVAEEEFTATSITYPEANEVKLVVLKSEIKGQKSLHMNRSFKQRTRTNLRRTARVNI